MKRHEGQLVFFQARAPGVLLQRSLLEGGQSTNVVPERGFAFGLSQHEDLLLGHSGGEGGVLLSQEEVAVRPGHR